MSENLNLTFAEKVLFANVVGRSPDLETVDRDEAGRLWSMLFDVYDGDSQEQMDLCRKLHNFAFMPEAKSE